MRPPIRRRTACRRWWCAAGAAAGVDVCGPRQRGLGEGEFPVRAQVRGAAQVAAGIGVRADLMALVADPPHQFRMAGRLIAVEEERRPRVPGPQQVEQARGPHRVGPAVESERGGTERHLRGLGSLAGDPQYRVPVVRGPRMGLVQARLCRAPSTSWVVQPSNSSEAATMGRISSSNNQCQRGGRRNACRPCPDNATMGPFCRADVPHQRRASAQAAMAPARTNTSRVSAGEASRRRAEAHRSGCGHGAGVVREGALEVW